MATRVLACLAIETAALLAVNGMLNMFGWMLFCSAADPCDEGDAWMAFTVMAGIASSISFVYLMVSLVLGRTPLMVAARVPSLWRAFRGSTRPS